jgi:hypothetical protein
VSSPDNFHKPEIPHYERPAGKYQCGRAACWRKPCSFGPKPNGECGGTTECTPIKKGDRFECNRPAAFGGQCDEGPLPDGSCCRQQPACVPQLTLRARRRRLSELAALLVVAGILASFHFGDPNGWTQAVNPGRLSSKHANLAGIGESDCFKCHAAHDKGMTGWIKTIASPSHDPAECLNCHVFGSTNSGLETKAHNALFLAGTNTDKVSKTDCAMCHTEHHGSTASLTTITDAQCNFCHAKNHKFKSFSGDHAPFPHNFPHDHPTAIHFDHKLHIETAFPQYDPERTCTDCHVVEGAGRMVATKPFAQSCTGCHDGKGHEKTVDSAAQQQNLAVLVLPKTLDVLDLGALPPLILYLLNDDGKDTNRLRQSFVDFLTDLSKDGTALQKKLNERSGQECANLLEGLNPAMIAAAAQVVLTNGTNDWPSPGRPWFWEENRDQPDQWGLYYHATTHSDLLLHEWIEFASKISSETPTNNQANPAAQKIREQFIDRAKGIGNCAQCHTSFEETLATGEGKHTEQWHYIQFSAWPNTTFSHKVHLNLADKCGACHVLDTNAKLATQLVTASQANEINLGMAPVVSNFKSIGKELCAKCHYAGNMRQDCQLCHVYHRNSSLKPEVKPLGRDDQTAKAAKIEEQQKQIEDAKNKAQDLAKQAIQAKEEAEAAAQKRAGEEAQAQAELKQKQEAAAQARIEEQKQAEAKASADKIAQDKAAEEAEAQRKAKEKNEAADAEKARQLAEDKRKADEERQRQDDLARQKAEVARQAQEQLAAKEKEAEQKKQEAEKANLVKEEKSKDAIIANNNSTAATSGAKDQTPLLGAYVGPEKCDQCHHTEVSVWNNTAHADSINLHHSKRANTRKILDALAGQGTSPRNSSICQQCHYTLLPSTPVSFRGVSCESCHGAASLWIDIHKDTVNKPDKVKRMEESRQNGMIHPGVKKGLVQNCLGCHNYEHVDGANYEAMVAAGHPISVFEFVQFSQGTVRHRFYKPDGSPSGKDNLALNDAEKSEWYVIGQAAELVSSTRQLSKAKGDGAEFKKLHQSHIEKATEVLGKIDLAEAKALLGDPSDPTDEKLTALISACEGKDFNKELGAMLPKEADYK